MGKKSFYRIQAEAFRDYANKFPEARLVDVFNRWTDSKDFCGVDRQEIWRVARRIRPKKFRVIEEGSQEFVRLAEVLEILFQHDSERLSELSKKKIDKT